MESYSVRAVLSAKDAGFTETMETAQKSANGLKGLLGKGLGFGVMAGLGHKAFSAVTAGIGGMVTELSGSGAAWKTFEGNMEILGIAQEEIKATKKELQEFAQKTIYSASDMSGTYSQLAAVGIRSANKLVTGFGGIAAAAENPRQAMKTLSQQGVQMAAKPYVAWQDFKLMLEQTPAGIAAVAKEMGMTTSELVSSVQDGTVATQDFFDAVIAVGNSDAFASMATQYKTTGQAMDGLRETAANKLGPAFGVLESIGIRAIEGIAGTIEKIDGEALATKVSGWVEKATPYWESFKEVASAVGGVIKKVAGFFLDHSEAIAKALPYILAAVAAYKTLKVVNTIAPGMATFTKSILGLASGGLSGLAGKLFGVSAGTTATGKASKASSKSVLAMAKSSMMLGAAVLMIAGGFAILAYSSIQLADAGGLAIGVMVGMTAAVAGLLVGGMAAMKTFSQTPAKAQAGAVALIALGAAVLLVSTGLSLLAFASIQLADAGGPAIACMIGMVAAVALLAVGAAALAPALTAGAVGLIAFGAAIVLVSVGALLSAQALTMVASVLPIVCAYGMQGATAITALGLSLIVLGTSAMVAGAGITVFSASLLALGAGALVAGAGMLVFGAGIAVGAAGALAMSAALGAVNSKMKSIQSAANSVNSSMNSMTSSISVVESGLSALGSKAKSVMSSLTSAFDNTSSKAIASGRKLGTGYAQGVESGCNKASASVKRGTSSMTSAMNAGRASAVSIANSMSSGIVSALSNASSGAYNCGSMIGAGLANGMSSQLWSVQSAAAQLAAAAEKAIRAKAQIHSPSKVSGKLGEYYTGGWINSLKKGVKKAYKVATELVSIPNVKTPELALAGYNGVELSSEYLYSRNDNMNITVVSEIDGREVARSTAVYTKDEINKIDKKNRRKKGLR